MEHVVERRPALCAPVNPENSQDRAKLSGMDGVVLQDHKVPFLLLQPGAEPSFNISAL